MQHLWGIVTVLALVAGYVSGQFGRNYGVNVRLGQSGLSYAAQKAVNDLYDKYRNEPIPDFSGSSGRTSYNVWNIKIPSLSRPTFNLRINQGQGVSPIMNLGHITVTGNFRVSYKLGWFRIRKSGTFTATANQISLNVGMGVGREATGRPTVSVRSCTSSIGSFRVDVRASGIIGWIINLLEGRISRSLKDEIVPMLCEQVRKLVDRNVNPELREMKVSTTLQDGRLQIDYSLMRAPTFGANYIDTTVKGDVSWKGRKTNTPTGVRSWPTVPGSSSRMATIYLTDYIMNALGVLMNNDGSLSYNVTRNEVSSRFRSQLALTCPNSACAGTLFPELADQYPDGWLEAGLRTNSPPRIVIGNNVLTGRFSGILEVYVRRPNGQRIRAATATASLDIPLSLTISNNILKASVNNPRISVTPGQARTDGLREFLSLLSQGFSQLKLQEIGQKGFELPTFKKVVFVNPQIYIGQGVIAISTDVNYTG
uniref:LBP/BPI n=1 Tax=Perinereis linea TaxID=2507842 RepID=A0A481MSM9_9ANNE|nr:LBP/BPI [Perinereis linea]